MLSRNVYKMIVVRLLLFSVLLYNTEARLDDELDDTSGTKTIATNATMSVEDTTQTNGTDSIGWYYGSVAADKTKNYDSTPVEAKTSDTVKETNDWWSYGSAAPEKTKKYETTPVEDKPPDPVKETNDLWSYGSVAADKTKKYDTTPVEAKTPDPVKETNDWWSYGSAAPEKTKKYETTPVEDKPPDPVKETNDLWSYGSVAADKTKKYDTTPVEAKTPDTVKETNDWWSYGSVAGDKNETRDYKTVPVENPPVVNDKKPANFTYTFADIKPYVDDFGYFTVDNGILTAHFPKTDTKTIQKSEKPYNSISGIDENTTSSRRPYNTDWYYKLEKSRTTTETIVPPTSGRSYYWYGGTETEMDIKKAPLPNYWYNKTVKKPETTTTKRSYYEFWRKAKENAKKSTTPRNLWYKWTTPAPYNVGTTTDTEHNITTTDVNYNWVTQISPKVDKTGSLDRNVTTDQVNPETPTSRRDRVNVSINSSINGNDAYYGAFTSFLKKMAGTFLQSTSNVAPNANITNLAVTNGNGNLFFFIS